MNPVYTAPVDLDFAQALQKVPLRIHHGLVPGRHARAPSLTGTIPAAHELESWGDARAFDGHGHPDPAADRVALRRQDGPGGPGAAFSGRTDAGQSMDELVQQFCGKIRVAAPEAGTGVVLTASPDPTRRAQRHDHRRGPGQRHDRRCCSGHRRDAGHGRGWCGGRAVSSAGATPSTAESC